jgi:hypothetical protein
VAKRSNDKWSVQEDLHLLEMRSADKSAVLMAAILRRTVKAVRGRLAILRARERAKVVPTNDSSSS